MASSYQKPITMYKALLEIEKRKYLLPAIQREFVWNHEQICKLFDSMMRGYPINTFMFWQVTDKKVVSKFKFYEILREYCENLNDKTIEYKRIGSDFTAVIDGQQRLTAMNIGLNGTYAYKLPYKRLGGPQNEVYPPRKLYLELTKRLSLQIEKNEEKMECNFRFLTEKEVTENNNKGEYWYEVGKILEYRTCPTQSKAVTELSKFVVNDKIPNPEIAQELLISLHNIVFVEEIIHYYLEESQDTERVLDVFIRTNSGGTQLEYSDLLMSIAVDSWTGDARKQIDGLVKEIKSIGYRIDRDYVLKTCLMLIDHNVQFRLKNFSESVVKSIVEQWDGIQKCIIETFNFMRSIGLNDYSLKAKNATIPIAFYLYYTGKEKDRVPLYNSINKPSFPKEERDLIKKWLIISILKQVFGGHSDGFLTNLRKIIKSNGTLAHFPFSHIRATFKGKSKNIDLTDDFVDDLMSIQKNDTRCRPLLSILFPDMDLTRSFDIDHLHPETSFSEDKLKRSGAITDATLLEFYKDKKNWNALPNLHLLYESDNKSKNKTPLAEWLGKNKSIKRSDLLIPDAVDLEFEKFKDFYEARRELLKKKISELLN